MKILIDMTHINIDLVLASTSIYVFRIINSIENINKQNITLLINPNLEEFIKKNYPDYKYIIFPYINEKVSKYKKGIAKFLLQAKKYYQIIKESQCEGLLIANNLYYYTCIPTKLKKIVVIHDLKAIKDRNKPQRLVNYVFYALLMLFSYKTIAISEFTKQDILRNYSKLFKNKIKVIYNSIQLSDKITHPSLLPPNTNYILYVNTLHEYKNIQTLLKALSLIENLSHKLVVVGKSTPYWMNQMIPYLKKKNLSDKIIHLEYVTDEELHWLYKHASLFVSCSTREGFGYTPIEAAICQCPVICSTCESLPETTLNKLEYYNPPYNAIELSQKISKLLANPPSLSALESVSSLFSQKYSLKKQTLDILNLFLT